MKGSILTQVPSELVSATPDGVVVSADGVYDYISEKTQEAINREKADKNTTVSTVKYDTSRKKLTKTINNVTTDIVSANTLVLDAIPDLGDIRSGALAGAKAYQKPGSGIPASDLSLNVRNSLVKANESASLATTYTKLEVNILLASVNNNNLVFDETPTENSNNPVTSKGIKAAIDAEASIRNANDSALSTLISNCLNSLLNYYLKTETYSKSEIQNLLNNIGLFRYEIVEELPSASANTTGGIYLVPSSSPINNDTKEEYITINNGGLYVWEHIGSTSIDLNGYSTTEQMNSAINEALTSYYTKTNINSLLEAKQSTISDLETIRTGAAKGMTAYQIPSGGIPKGNLTTELKNSINLADSAYLKPETGIPKTDLASEVLSSLNLANTALLQHQDISGKVNSADLATVATTGSYNDLSNKPVIPTIPTNVSSFTNDAGYLTLHLSLTNYALKTEIPTKVSDLDNDSGFLTLHLNLENYVLKSLTTGLLKNDGTIDTNTYLTLHLTLKTINGQTITGTGNIQIASEGSLQLVQSDWNLSNDSAVDYIKNKPTIPSLSGYATETWVGQLGFLTLHLSLTNYILKSLTVGLLKNDGTVDENTYLTLHQSLTNYIQKNQTAGLVKNDGTIDTNTYLTLHQSLTDYALKSELFSGSYDDLTDKPTIPSIENCILKSSTAGLLKNDGTVDTNTYLTSHQDISGKADISSLATVATSGDYDDLSNKPTIPTNVSSLTNDANYITGMVILNYGSSTWNDFISAYNANKVVYCRASSNSNPASGSQTRLAFMAYVNNATNPTEVEFLYYRSVSTHSDNQLGDLVFVYKLVSNGTWTVTTRNAFTKIAAGTNMTSSYSNGLLTLKATLPDLTNYVLKSETTGLLKNDGTIDLTSYSTFSGSYNDLSDTPSDISEFNNDSEYVSYDKATLENSSMLLKSAGGGIATIDNIKGNTVAWNQLMPNGNFATGSWNTSNATLSVSNNVGTMLVSAQDGYIRNAIVFIRSHKYCIICDIKASSNLVGINVGGILVSGHSGSDSFERMSYYLYDTNGSRSVGVIDTRSSGWDSVQVKDYCVFDLTLIYGAGNEPTTVAQFEADYFRWFGKPLTYEPYDEGSLKPVLMSEIKTTGFNQWDEEWESGDFDNNGLPSVNANWIRSKNFNPILPNTQYYKKTTANCYVLEYDTNYNYIGVRTANFFTSSSNTAYFKLQIFGTTYNHDICINISDPVKNGTYEPYEEHIKTLDITTLKGKLNGSGNSVIVFPDGLKKAGSVYDEIKVESGVVKAIKRVGSVDMGDLDWDVYSANSANNLFTSTIPNKMVVSHGWRVGGVCDKYTISGSSNSTETPDKCFSFGWESTAIFVKDTSYSDASTFETAMNGVMLYYELATPEEYILDDISTPINYYVNLYGTEELIQQSNGVAATIVTTYNGELGKDLSKILPASAITGDSNIPAGMVTSSTSGLKIEVVLSLPATPDSNTIYIVLSVS